MIRISYHKPDCQNRDCKNPREIPVYHMKRMMYLCTQCAIEVCELLERQQPIPGFFTP